jgi:hypothetical protein
MIRLGRFGITPALAGLTAAAVIAALYTHNVTNQVHICANGGGTVNYGAPLQLGVRIRGDF